MVTDELLEANWQKYGVLIDGQVYALKDRYAYCSGRDSLWGGLVFDQGGTQPGICHVYIVGEDGETLVSVNPHDHSETTVIGKLVLLTT